MELNDINEIHKAIDVSDLLSKSQKEILKYIVSFDLERGLPAISIMKHLEVTKQAISFSLKQLMNRKFLTRYKDKVFVYRINRQRLEEIITDYRKMIKLQND
jgi:predicted transcriptional regulator